MRKWVAICTAIGLPLLLGFVAGRVFAEGTLTGLGEAPHRQASTVTSTLQTLGVPALISGTSGTDLPWGQRVDCPAGQVLTGGGARIVTATGEEAGGSIISSYPVGSPPTGWVSVATTGPLLPWQSQGDHLVVFAICAGVFPQAQSFLPVQLDGRTSTNRN